MKIKVTINRLVENPDTAVKAFASVTLDGLFAVHGVRRGARAGVHAVKRIPTVT